MFFVAPKTQAAHQLVAPGMPACSFEAHYLNSAATRDTFDLFINQFSAAHFCKRRGIAFLFANPKRKVTKEFEGGLEAAAATSLVSLLFSLPIQREK
jgi:hypothetical protein